MLVTQTTYPQSYMPLPKIGNTLDEFLVLGPTSWPAFKLPTYNECSERKNKQKWGRF